MGRKGCLFIGAVVAWLALAPSVFAFGSFTGYEPYPTGGPVYGADLGDFTGDGIPDMVAATSSPSHISLLHGRKSGLFNRKGTVNIVDPRDPEGIVIGKLNAGKLLDFAAADFNGGADSTVSIFLAKSTGKPKLFGTPLPTGPGARFIATADLNGDHKSDLVTGNANGDAGADSISVLLGMGNGRFEDHVDYLGSSGAVIGLAVGDMNGGSPDIVTLDDAGNIAVLLGVGDGTFGAPVVTPAITGGDVPGNGIVLGDFDEDGSLDAVVPDQTSNQVAFFAGNNDGTFDLPVGSTSSGSPNGIAAADFDRDGHLDLAIGVTTGLYGMRIVIGVGDGTFTFGSYNQGDVSPEDLGPTEIVVAKRFSAGKEPDVLAGADGGVNAWVNCKSDC